MSKSSVIKINIIIEESLWDLMWSICMSTHIIRMLKPGDLLRMHLLSHCPLLLLWGCFLQLGVTIVSSCLFHLCDWGKYLINQFLLLSSSPVGHKYLLDRSQTCLYLVLLFQEEIRSNDWGGPLENPSTDQEIRHEDKSSIARQRIYKLIKTFPL